MSVLTLYLGGGGEGGWKEPHEVEREVHQLLGVKSVSWGGGEDGKNRTK